MTPSLEIGNGNWAVKSDSLLGYKTIDGKYYPREMSVVRATTGTRVNAAGLVELVPYNLLQYSEQFENASWNKLAINITANSTISPTGITNADTIAADGSASIHRISSNNFSSVAGTTYTASIYAKKNTNDFFQIYLNSFLTTTFANFDINNGTLGTVGSTATAKIENVGNGWFRCSITTTQSTSSLSSAAFSIITSASSPRVEVNTLSTSVFLWGAQINEGTEPLEYLPTTDRLDIARVDYSTGEAALLVEPQRTNLVTYSEQFDNAIWNKSNVNVTANTTISPSGIVNADTITADGTNVQHYLFNNNAYSVISGNKYTISTYAKKNTNNFIQLQGFVPTFGTNVWANFNLNNGVIGTVGSAATAEITSIGNGWYRCSITATAIASAFTVDILALVTSATSNRGEINTLTTSVFLWGFQAEAGEYPTSYIPTISATVTRNADVVQKTGVSSLIGQTEGTLYWEGTMTSGQVADLFYINLSVINSVFIYKTAVNAILFRVIYGGSFITIGNATSYTGLVKIAAAYKSGNSVLYINGVQTGSSATSFAFTGALNDVFLNNTAFLLGNEIKKSVKTAALFTTRLTNAELATLTTI
jgi:hypothetical protein